MNFEKPEKAEDEQEFNSKVALEKFLEEKKGNALDEIEKVILSKDISNKTLANLQEEDHLMVVLFNDFLSSLEEERDEVEKIKLVDIQEMIEKIKGEEFESEDEN